jgi:hypothetical protein
MLSEISQTLKEKYYMIPYEVSRMAKFIESGIEVTSNQEGNVDYYS